MNQTTTLSKNQFQELTNRVDNLETMIKTLLRNVKVISKPVEEPSGYMIKALKESKQDIKYGRISPSFTNAKDALAWLNNPKAKYASGIRKKI